MLFVILGIALVLFVTGWVAVDVTSMLVMVVLMVTGILTLEEGTAGFSNSATLTVLALLILSEGLKNTGAVDALGYRIIKITGNKEWWALVVLMVTAAVASAFINTTAVVAVFIPVAYKIAKSSNLNIGLLLMPLSFAAMVGGASTMIGTSTNLLINSISQGYGIERFRLFDLTLLGAILFVVLLVYMLFVGRFMLKRKREKMELMDGEVEVKNYLTEVEIVSGSALIGKPLMNTLKLSDAENFNILRIIRENATLPTLQVDKIKEGDILVIKTNIHEILRLDKDKDLVIRSHERLEGEKKGKRTLLFEALITPNSNLLDQKIKDISFLRYYNAVPLAVRKSGFIGHQKMMDHKLSAGDILLMEGAIDYEDSLYSRQDWVTIQRMARKSLEKHLYRRDKLVMSVFILFGVILLAVSNILPILISAWLGVIVMVFTRCISFKKAYENVEWKVFFLLAGLIPLGTAMSKTGADQLVADFITHLAWGTHPRFVISVLFLFTVLFTGIVSNQATAVLLVPIAIKVAASVSMAPEPLIIAILFGANTSFLTPVGYQTNAMIYGPGNYRFSDFVKVGGILCLLFWGVVTFLVPIFYGT
ncbi:SLC13 family permease [Fulvivirga maritima]|uniref:SLC13 family permease n=1 Tax=Fulvivirga maritima TaxID=2904247 RepID=UPI001F41D64A|nr:SLC13 family permease [Fulvivirga maritima]UII25029.1 SLC13 family permease [Fulvivirga maritima]